MVNKVLPSRSPIEREMPCSEDLASSMKNYTIDRVTVYFVFLLLYNGTLTKLKKNSKKCRMLISR